MLRDMSELSEAIHKEAIKHLDDKAWFLKTTNEANDKYNMSIGQASDYLNGNKKLKDDDDNFVGYVLASVIDSARPKDDLTKPLVKEFFTPLEISYFRGATFEDNVIKRLDLPMIQVATDQWIGAVSFKQLMKIEDSRLMCYNENTQRVPRARTKGNGAVVYEPYVNMRSVKDIMTAFKRGDYIPNTITFNIRDGVEWHYEDGRIIIENFPEKTPVFDIIDGYHRYRAMRQIYISDPNFDYSMELRIVRFSVEKARQFIYQESLRNKMRTVDQASFNQNSVENQIIDELNETMPFRNMFSASDPKIDRSVMAAAIRNVYFRRAESRTRTKKIEVKKELVAKGKMLEDVHPEVFEARWANSLIVAFVVSGWNDDEEKFGRFVTAFDNYIINNNLVERKSTIENDIRKIIRLSLYDKMISDQVKENENV